MVRLTSFEITLPHSALWLQLSYTRAVWVCKPCAQGNKVFSRWLEDKEPTKERVKKGLASAAADSLRSSFKQLVGSGSAGGVATLSSTSKAVRGQLEAICEWSPTASAATILLSLGV